MKGTIILIIVLILIIITIVLSILVYKMYVIIAKIHTIISIDSIELEKIKDLAIKKNDSFSKIEQKINGMHTVISTQLVKGIMKSSKENNF
ncbi:hypothetical protein KAOT1_00105 [Kordia algicida OT-1]|uniref:Uncharacterized protein n=1 Tax=Kordia algicida OT-1 TaxID=391587 RepID=A9CU81_9FLAO|nr:hypothetical protein KAOT1_00105 [Kordia algicida OT-1]